MAERRCARIRRHGKAGAAGHQPLWQDRCAVCQCRHHARQQHVSAEAAKTGWIWSTSTSKACSMPWQPHCLIFSSRTRTYHRHILGRRTRSVPGNAVYCGTKHFVRAMLDSFRSEAVNEETNIRTTTIYPGAIQTELLNTVAPLCDKDDGRTVLRGGRDPASGDR